MVFSAPICSLDPSRQEVGVFDSGCGGLTVVRELRRSLPHEGIIYLGDTARLPYGNKDAATIQRYAAENVQFLKGQGARAIVSACHTASAVALEALQDRFDLPVLGLIAPSVAAAVHASKRGRIGVIATRATVRAGVYEREIKRYLPRANVIQVACPLFVSLVEEGYTDHPLVDLAAQEYLTPLREALIDTLILACTHFPLLKKAIQRVVGEEVILIDPAARVASQLAALFAKESKLGAREAGRCRFFVSDDPERFKRLGGELLGERIEGVELASYF